MESHRNENPGVNVGKVDNVYIGCEVHVYQSADASSTPEKIPSFIDTARQPVLHFKKTATYIETLDKCKQRERLILHCHGYPGTGKSQIVRKLATEFPFNLQRESPHFVKWHIECGDNMHDLKEKLKELVETMQKKFLLPFSCSHEEVIKSLDSDIAAPLVAALEESQIPILIVIEDVPIHSKKLMCDFLRKINSTQSSVIHVYLATRVRSVLFSKEESKNLNNYHKVSVPGFTKEEGVAYLLNREVVTDDEGDAAEKIYNRFSGNPLGLRSAKGFCEKSMLNYQGYLEWIEDDQNESFDLGEETTSEYGDQATHIFQAITLPFRPSEDADKSTKLLWNVLCCLSFLHYGQMPKFIIKHFCQSLREEKVKNVRLRNKIDVGQLITTMSDYQLCSVSSDGEYVDFHEVVLHAFRVIVSQKSDFHERTLVKTLHVLAGVMTKDLRKNVIIKNMLAASMHLETLLMRAKPFVSSSCDNVSKMIASHLYEVLGNIMIRKPSYNLQCENYLTMAKDIIWDIVTDLAEVDSGYRNLLVPGEEAVDDVAKKIVKFCNTAGNKLEQGFVTDYQIAVSQLRNGEELEFLERKSENKQKFTEFKNRLSGSSTLDLQLVNLLRESGVFLPEQRQQSVFFAERLSNVLHSRSRIFLYNDMPQHASHVAYEWYSSMSHAIAFHCRQTHGVGLLVEHLSIRGGIIPIFLKSQKQKNIENDRLDILEQAKNKCQEVLEDRTNVLKTDLYENGLLQEAMGTVHLKIFVIRNLVRVYAKLIKLRQNPEERAQGMYYCQQLSTLAEQNIEKWSSSRFSVVYCGKFHCACGDFQSGLDMFKKFLSIGNTLTSLNNTYPWVVYNFARCVVAGRLLGEKERAVQQCRIALSSKDDISPHLKNCFRTVLQDLQNLHNI